MGICVPTMPTSLRSWRLIFSHSMSAFSSSPELIALLAHSSQLVSSCAKRVLTVSVNVPLIFIENNLCAVNDFDAMVRYDTYACAGGHVDNEHLPLASISRAIVLTGHHEILTEPTLPVLQDSGPMVRGLMYSDQ
jgi:hypothetical protein